MNINENAMSEKLQAIQKRKGKDIQKTMKMLATGRRVNEANDDAAGLSIATRLTAKTQEQKKVAGTWMDSRNKLQAKDGVLESITNQLFRLKELAVQAQNGTLLDTDQTILQQEANGIVSSIHNMALHASYNGKPLFSSGVLLDGVNDLVRIPNPRPIQFGEGDFHVSVEFRLDQLTRLSQIFGMWNTGSIRGMEIQVFQQGYIEFGVKSGSHTTITSPSNTIKPGEFYQVEMSRKNGVVAAYLNGKKLTATRVVAGSVSTPSILTIGQEPNGAEHFKGIIKNMKVYNRSLSQQEMEKNRQGIFSENGLISQWLTSPSKNGVVKEEMGTGVNGVLVGGATRSSLADELGVTGMNIVSPSSLAVVEKAISLVIKERARSGVQIGTSERESVRLEDASRQHEITRGRIVDADIPETASVLFKQQTMENMSGDMQRRHLEQMKRVLLLLDN